MQGKVEIAGVNTAKLRVLKNDETMALLKRAKAGDQEAQKALEAAAAAEMEAAPAEAAPAEEAPAAE